MKYIYWNEVELPRYTIKPPWLITITEKLKLIAFLKLTTVLSPLIEPKGDLLRSIRKTLVVTGTLLGFFYTYFYRILELHSTNIERSVTSPMPECREAVEHLKLIIKSMWYWFFELRQILRRMTNFRYLMWLRLLHACILFQTERIFWASMNEWNKLLFSHRCKIVSRWCV